MCCAPPGKSGHKRVSMGEKGLLSVSRYFWGVVVYWFPIEELIKLRRKLWTKDCLKSNSRIKNSRFHIIKYWKSNSTIFYIDSTICFAIFYLSISSAVGTISTALKFSFMPPFRRGGGPLSWTAVDNWPFYWYGSHIELSILRSIIGCPGGMSMIWHTRSRFRHAFRANLSLSFRRKRL